MTVDPGSISRRRFAWVRPMLLFGIAYALIGIVFALPGNHVKLWRLAAWVISAAAFGVHLGYEHARLGNPARPAAVHVALAVAFGAFGLAVGANLHSLGLETGSTHRRLLLLALGIWPVLAGVPAFVVALLAGRIRASFHARAMQG